MNRAGYGVAASVGAAVGFGALGWLAAAALALAAGTFATGLGVVPVRQGGWGTATMVFLDQPLRIAHAVVWCVALVLAALFAQAWG